MGVADGAFLIGGYAANPNTLIFRLPFGLLLRDRKLQPLSRRGPESHCNELQRYTLAFRLERETEDLDSGNWVMGSAGSKSLEATFDVSVGS